MREMEQVENLKAKAMSSGLMIQPTMETLRDQLAMAAMQGLMSNGCFDPDSVDDEELSGRCYDIADAMLKARIAR